MTTQEIEKLMETILQYAKDGKEITSNADLHNKYLSNRYVLKVTIFGGEELYSFRDWDEANEYFESFPIDDKDMAVTTYDLGNIGFDTNDNMFFDSIY
jgi:hypothetical protein